MLKKIIFVLVVITLLGLNSYQVYTLRETNQKITNLEEQLSDTKKEQEYLSLYEELEKEIGDITNIEDKIGLLKREYKENEEGLVLSSQDLENIKNKNNEVEKKIIEIETRKKQEEEQKITTSFPTYHQFPNYPTGCESVALYLLLKYYQIDVQVEDIVNKLKKGSLPYKNNRNYYGGNPEVEFIGDPRTNYSYGVYNKPIATVASNYKSGVITKTNFDFSEVLKLVQNNHPVLVWTTINLSKPFISTSWTYSETGEVIKWISGEHAMVIFGVSDNKVIASDPYTGTIRYFDKNLFESRYNYLGKRVIYYE